MGMGIGIEGDAMLDREMEVEVHDEEKEVEMEFELEGETETGVGMEMEMEMENENEMEMEMRYKRGSRFTREMLDSMGPTSVSRTMGGKAAGVTLAAPLPQIWVQYVLACVADTGGWPAIPPFLPQPGAMGGIAGKLWRDEGMMARSARGWRDTGAGTWPGDPRETTDDARDHDLEGESAPQDHDIEPGPDVAMVEKETHERKERGANQHGAKKAPAEDGEGEIEGAGEGEEYDGEGVEEIEEVDAGEEGGGEGGDEAQEGVKKAGARAPRSRRVKSTPVRPAVDLRPLWQMARAVARGDLEAVRTHLEGAKAALRADPYCQGALGDDHTVVVTTAATGGPTTTTTTRTRTRTGTTRGLVDELVYRAWSHALSRLGAVVSRLPLLQLARKVPGIPPAESVSAESRSVDGWVGTVVAAVVLHGVRARVDDRRGAVALEPGIYHHHGGSDAQMLLEQMEAVRGTDAALRRARAVLVEEGKKETDRKRKGHGIGIGVGVGSGQGGGEMAEERDRMAPQSRSSPYTTSVRRIRELDVVDRRGPTESAEDVDMA